MSPMEHAGRMAVDGAAGAAAVTAPLWLQHIETGAQLVVALGGVVLIALRIAVAWRDFRRHRGRRE